MLNEFMYRYGTIISYNLKLRSGYLHSKAMNTAENNIERGMDQRLAIRMALIKYKHYFEVHVRRIVENDTDDGEESDNESDENSEQRAK